MRIFILKKNFSISILCNNKGLRLFVYKLLGELMKNCDVKI